MEWVEPASNNAGGPAYQAQEDRAVMLASADPKWLTDPNAVRSAQLTRAEAATDKAYAELIKLHCQMVAACASDALPTTHREKSPDWSKVVFPCFVARKVPKGEASWNPKVKIAIEAEKQKHLNAPWPVCKKRNPSGKGKGTWEVSSVQERDTLVANAKKQGKIIHLARVHALCYEKMFRASTRRPRAEDESPISLLRRQRR